MIVYSRHVRENMDERKIHPVWVEETIRSPDVTTREGVKWYAVKRLNGKTLKVVYVKEKYIKVVTLYFI